MRIVQNIATGGIKSTRTPILKLWINELLLPRDARHMAHCASVVVVPKSKTETSATIVTTESNKYRVLNFIPKP